MYSRSAIRLLCPQSAIVPLSNIIKINSELNIPLVFSSIAADIPHNEFLIIWNPFLIFFLVSPPRRKIRLIEGNAKCHQLKTLTCKGTLRQVYIRVYRLEIKSVMLVFFRPLLWTVAPVPSLWSPPHPSPLPKVNVQYIQTVCGYGGCWVVL